MPVVANRKVVNMETGKAAAGKRSERLQSLDALRGFDMFWIMSGEIVVHNLATATNAPAAKKKSFELAVVAFFLR